MRKKRHGRNEPEKPHGWNDDGARGASSSDARAKGQMVQVIDSIQVIPEYQTVHPPSQKRPDESSEEKEVECKRRRQDQKDDQRKLQRMSAEDAQVARKVQRGRICHLKV